MRNCRARNWQCLWGKAHKRVFLDVSEDVLMSLCVVDLVLSDIGYVSAGMCVCVCVPDRPDSKVAVFYGKVTERCLSRRKQKMGGCYFAWHAWYFVTFEM